MGALNPISWQGFSAWTLESPSVRMVLLPELGAKIVSLFDKRAGFEWLVSPMRPLKSLVYASSFVDQDMSGWDEMFPTITACTYPGDGIFFGRSLPDHGEVWSLPWSLEEQTGDSLLLGIQGKALPYRLLRRVSLAEADLIRFEYHLINIGSQPFNYIWAAHPQFAADVDTVITLPEGVQQVVNVLPSAAWGDAGTCYSWPVAQSTDGVSWKLDRIGAPERADCRKFYLPPDFGAGWAGLTNLRSGCSLKMEWSPSELPYLGIWVDEGAYNSASVAALEPSTGYYDSLFTAMQNGRLSRIVPGEEHCWRLSIRLLVF